MNGWSRRQIIGAGLGLLTARGGRLFAGEPPRSAVERTLSWLDNGTIKIGVDLTIGGAITWLSRSGSDVNLINSSDWGRQVQMSYYAGPVPYLVGEKRPAKAWEHIGWNPIQAGDDFGHGSRTIEHRNDGRVLYVKCIPMQWPLDNEPGECTFESWLELDGAAVKARCRLVNARADHTQYSARGQELPAVYTNGPWHRLVTYSGDKPFTGGAVTQLEAQPPPRWSMWMGTERWTALVDDSSWGVGVWNPGCVRFGGGFNGKPGAGGAKDTACGYISPSAIELLDHDITHEYHYDLVLGTVEEIRAHVYRQPRPAVLPTWKFDSDRQGWSYLHARDTGWPIRGELNVQLIEADPGLVSPHFTVAAEGAPVLIIDAALAEAAPRPQLFWETLEQPGLSEERSVRFEMQADGQFREYRVRLADSEHYRGLITSVRFDPADAAGGTLRVREIRFAAE